MKVRINNHEPNIQNIPIRTKEGKAIRDAFIRDMPEVDYSAIEKRIWEQMNNEE